jgi:hypothetical protein
MRVVTAAQTGAASVNGARRAASPGGFSLEGTSSAKSPTSTGAALGIQSVDALLALQGVEDATERRKRSVKRGNSALELLDALKVEILEGRVGLETLRRLDVVLQGMAERSGEQGLDEVIDAISVRVAVELAKRRPAQLPAA